MRRSLPPTRRTSNGLPVLELPRLFRSLLLALALSSLGGCEPAALRPELAEAAVSAIGLSDALEKLIEEQLDTEEDREAAYDAVQKLPADTAADAFGRAAIAGRLAEKKGALSLLGSQNPTSLVAEAEKYALRSQKLDPSFRRAAATRMLGTLYVLAPANMLEGGDSEDGLSLLEGLVKSDPGLVDNQFRLAEAYIALGDKEPAREPLCRALAKQAELRKDQGRALDVLKAEFKDLDCSAWTTK